MILIPYVLFWYWGPLSPQKFFSSHQLANNLVSDSIKLKGYSSSVNLRAAWSCCLCLPLIVSIIMLLYFLGTKKDLHGKFPSGPLQWNNYSSVRHDLFSGSSSQWLGAILRQPIMRKARKWEGGNIAPPSSLQLHLHCTHSLPHAKQQEINIQDWCRDLCIHW